MKKDAMNMNRYSIWHIVWYICKYIHIRMLHEEKMWQNTSACSHKHTSSYGYFSRKSFRLLVHTFLATPVSHLNNVGASCFTKFMLKNAQSGLDRKTVNYSFSVHLSS
jgi:hypothetical protein